MNFDKEKNRDRHRNADQPLSDQTFESEFRSKPKSKRKPGSGDVGDALRSAYQRTVSEDIPSEMLDLLGKLG